jgi:hypothetical protein
MGVVNTELWNNLGLCCFYSSQYDMALTCFERALQLADDSSLPDVWCARIAARAMYGLPLSGSAAACERELAVVRRVRVAPLACNEQREKLEGEDCPWPPGGCELGMAGRIIGPSTAVVNAAQFVIITVTCV